MSLTVYFWEIYCLNLKLLRKQISQYVNQFFYLGIETNITVERFSCPDGKTVTISVASSMQQSASVTDESPGIHIKNYTYMLNYINYKHIKTLALCN